MRILSEGEMKGPLGNIIPSERLAEWISPYVVSYRVRHCYNIAE